jgi:hypothetical protein
MNDDLVERAAAIVRERYDGAGVSAGRTEERVLLRLHVRSRRRHVAPMFAIPLVAALMASVAWGTVTGNLGVAVRAVTRALGVTRRGPAASRLRGSAAATASASNVQPEPEPTKEVASSGSAPVSDAQPVGVPTPPLPSARRSAPKPNPISNDLSQPPAHSPSAPDIDALYRAAHHAQFFGRDPAAALALWDRYLAAAPNGSMAPEARYNRAIALYRLGRKSEAADALESFARGDYGPYRQDEAQALLKTLRP